MGNNDNWLYKKITNKLALGSLTPPNESTGN